jgi:hypothetical protein
MIHHREAAVVKIEGHHITILGQIVYASPPCVASKLRIFKAATTDATSVPKSSTSLTLPFELEKTIQGSNQEASHQKVLYPINIRLYSAMFYLDSSSTQPAPYQSCFELHVKRSDVESCCY